MPTFYDLRKYATTGKSSSNMTGYDKLKALAMFGGGFPVNTLTGVPPISFQSDGTPLISWSMKGNGQQTGTPTPDAPIMPEFVGVRTGNLVQLYQYSSRQSNHYYIDYNTVIGSSGMSDLISAINAATDVDDVFLTFETDNDAFAPNLYVTYEGGTTADKRNIPFVIDKGKKVSALIIRARSGSSDYDGTVVTVSNFMLNTGSTALQYEPYGWKIPITCAGQTVPVYLGQMRTVRRVRKLVLDGTERWSTNWRPETGTYAALLFDATGKINNTLVCTHAESNSYEHLYNGAIGVSTVPGAIYLIAMRVPDTIASNDAEFKAYLAEQYANGTPVTVWYVLATPETAIVNEPLAKIGDYADELHSTDAGVSIPTAKGSNTLTVETDLQPSEVSITGRIKPE